MKHQLKTIRSKLSPIADGDWDNEMYVIDRAKQALTALSELERMAGEQEPITREHHLALREAHHITDSKAYFKARAELNSYGGRTAFEAGYQRGFDAAEKVYATPPAQQPQYEAGDMASAAAQGFRDGVASVAQQPQTEKRCQYCDGTGDVHSIDGQWRGECHCQKQAQAEAVPLDMGAMELAESVGLIGPASRTDDFHAAIQRFHDLISMNVSIKAAVHFAQGLPKKGGAA